MGIDEKYLPAYPYEPLFRVTPRSFAPESIPRTQCLGQPDE